MAEITSTGGEKVANPSGVNNQGGGGQPSGGGMASSPNNPALSGGASVVELTEDSMVRLPGAKDPVRYGDHSRNFQSEFTKRAQAASDAKKQIQQLQAQLDDHKRRSQSPQAQTQQDPRQEAQARAREFSDGLKSLTYLSGTDAARVVEHLTQQFSGFESALQQRDIALGLMYRRLQEIGQGFQGIQGKATQQDFDTKISSFVKTGGLPEKATNWAKELYLAYEGDDLDQEFPRILKERWNELKSLHEEGRKQQAEQARRQPFVPGKGGNGSPSRPLQNLARASAKDIADAMWPGGMDVET